MTKHFTVCANRPFINGVCEVTVQRTFFNFPTIVVSIEGYILPYDVDKESIDHSAKILADAHRKVHLLHLIANRTLPRRKI